MASDLISYLMQDQVTEWKQEKAEWEQEKAEWEQEKAEWEQEKATLERTQAELRTALEREQAAVRDAAMQEAALKTAQQAIEDILIARFPDTPLTVMRDIRRITNPERLQALIGPLVAATTLDEARRLLAEAASANGM
jgi:septal ring factor EnvC (AmiA/AmiB activator)